MDERRKPISVFAKFAFVVFLLALPIGFYVFIAAPLYIAVFPAAGVPTTSTLDPTETTLVLSNGSFQTPISVPKVYIDRWVDGEDGHKYSVALHLILPDLQPWRPAVEEYRRKHGLTKRETQRALRQQEMYLSLWGTDPGSKGKFVRNTRNVWMEKWVRIGIYDDDHDLYKDNPKVYRPRWYIVPRVLEDQAYYVRCFDLTPERKDWLCTMYFYECESIRSYIAYPMGRLSETASIHRKAKNFTRKLCTSDQSLSNSN